MLDAFLWWLTFLLLGLAALPITLALFRNLPDRGYAFSRPLGLLLFAYLFWILGLARVLPNSRLGASIALALLLAIALALLLRRRRAVLRFLSRNWGVVLATEGVFALVFVVWGIVRSYTPAIVHTEQPMDFALLNGILASPHFPPNDPWFAGEPISYYYFGYFMSAGLTHLTGIASSVAYNLSLMSIAAMAATGAMSLVYNLVRTMRRPRDEEGGEGAPRRAGAGTALLLGALGVVLLLFLGNLVGLLEFMRVNDIGSAGFFRWIDIDQLTATSAGSTWYPSDHWWWFRSTRVINTFIDGGGVDFTITEFPFFSFLLGDLHPHVMSLPFVLLAVGLSYNAVRSPVALGLGWLRSRPWEVLLVALLLGSLGFLNSWDLPTFAALFFAALLLRAFQGQARGEEARLKPLALLMALIALGAVLLYIPFYLDLNTQASGILPVRRSMTQPLHFVLFWGPFLLLNLSVLAALAWHGLRRPAVASLRRWLGRTGPDDGPGQGSSTNGPRRSRWWSSPALWAAGLPLIPFALWALAELGMSLAGSTRLLRPDHSGAVTESLLSIGTRFWHVLPFFIILGLILGLLFQKARREGTRSAPTQFLLLLMGFAFLLTMGAELFHISDLFGNRMNTVFKFYYQAWVLLAVGGAVSVYFWSTRPVKGSVMRRAATPALMGIFAVVVAAAFVYVPPAIYSKAERFKPDPTLDGLAASALADPAEHAAVLWLRDNAEDTSVIVEASPIIGGRPSGDYNPAVSRISQRTGLPTILGWPGHEHQWRGNPFDPIAERGRDVETVYQSQDIEKVQSTLDKYDVSHVIVGALERRTYGPDVGERLGRFMDIAFQNDGVVIYVRRAVSPGSNEG